MNICSQSCQNGVKDVITDASILAYSLICSRISEDSITVHNNNIHITRVRACMLKCMTETVTDTCTARHSHVPACINMHDQINAQTIRIRKVPISVK